MVFEFYLYILHAPLAKVRCYSWHCSIRLVYEGRFWVLVLLHLGYGFCDLHVAQLAQIAN